jgi:hypothetical protein
MASIIRITGQEAYDLIYEEHLSTLSTINQETMQRAMANSTRVWLGEDDGAVIAVWGLIPPTLMSDVAYLWLFTTKNLTRHTFIFIRHSQKAVQAMLSEFPMIIGHAELANHKSIQWLKWLGAEFGEPIAGKAIPFTIKAKQWPQDSAQSA